jgi:hypothetical protein
MVDLSLTGEIPASDFIEVFLMRFARWSLLFILVSFGAAFAQSTATDNTAQKPQNAAKPSPAKPLKENKDAAKEAKKRDKESAKKADNAQNQVNAEAYRTTVRKP